MDDHHFEAAVLQELQMMSEVFVGGDEDKSGLVGWQDLHFLIDSNAFNRTALKRHNCKNRLIIMLIIIATLEMSFA